jgi:hypothetical protein
MRGAQSKKAFRLLLADGNLKKASHLTVFSWRASA